MPSTLLAATLAMCLEQPPTVDPGDVPRCTREETSARPWAGCDARDRDVLRQTIKADARLRARWTRGWVLVGVGIPVTLAGLGLAFRFVFDVSILCDGNSEHSESCRRGIPGLAGGMVLLAGATAMLGVGGHDIVQTKRGARRLHVSLSPTRRGAFAGLQLRF